MVVFDWLQSAFGAFCGDRYFSYAKKMSGSWNHFSIDVLTEDNQKRLAYAGNWRDIFQNWEALSASIPVFIEHISCNFVIASPAEG